MGNATEIAYTIDGNGRKEGFVISSIRGNMRFTDNAPFFPFNRKPFRLGLGHGHSTRPAKKEIQELVAGTFVAIIVGRGRKLWLRFGLLIDVDVTLLSIGLVGFRTSHSF
jgi:hypothetical protein